MSDCKKKCKKEQLNDEELMSVDGGKLILPNQPLYQQ